MYDYNAPGKGTENDVFKDLKQQALVLTKTFQRDDNRVAWVSIKLPLANQPAVQEALLDFAVLDLALKKFAPDALVLFARPSMDIRMDYLNRVSDRDTNNGIDILKNLITIHAIQLLIK